MSYAYIISYIYRIAFSITFLIIGTREKRKIKLGNHRGNNKGEIRTIRRWNLKLNDAFPLLHGCCIREA